MKRANLEFIKLCNEIDFLSAQLKEAEADAEYWRRQYNTLLDSNIKHGEEMIGSMLKVLMTPGVTDAFMANGERLDYARKRAGGCEEGGGADGD